MTNKNKSIVREGYTKSNLKEPPTADRPPPPRSQVAFRPSKTESLADRFKAKFSQAHSQSRPLIISWELAVEIRDALSGDSPAPDTGLAGQIEAARARIAGWPADVRAAMGLPDETNGVSHAATDVIAERKRQVTAEGWTPAHDDEHSDGALARAAACYAVGIKWLKMPRENTPYDACVWPFDSEWWKPSSDLRRNLVKAGALILAEIERLDRASGKHSPEEPAREHLQWCAVNIGKDCNCWCDHPRSELLASKGDQFEMRKCLECTKIFRVRLREKASGDLAHKAGDVCEICGGVWQSVSNVGGVAHVCPGSPLNGNGDAT